MPCRALASGRRSWGRLGGLWQRLWTFRDRGKELRLRWELGQCGLRGNEAADGDVWRGAGEELEVVGWSEGVRLSVLGEFSSEPRQDTHALTAATYAEGIKGEDEANLARADRVDLTSFRSNKQPKLGSSRACWAGSRRVPSSSVERMTRRWSIFG